jgi:hypothetical protein
MSDHFLLKPDLLLDHILTSLPKYACSVKCPAGILGNLHKFEIRLLSCFLSIILGFINKLN